MDITSFTVDKYENEQYDYKVLIYGNYTYRQNLEADSLVEVLRRVIPYLSEKHKIHFTIIVPELIKSLWFDNVEQKVIELPTYINQMRTHFDSEKFMEVIDWKRNDWDIIYTHLPEHTNQIVNCIYNNTNIKPKVIGYSHWFEVPENAPYEKTMFDAAIAGMLQMDECGVNSKWLKDLVLNYAEETYNKNTIDKLDRIIQPHYLGVDRVEKRTKYKDKTVLFNHRDAGYTGWDWFVKCVDEIWKTRKDFKVYTTMASVDREWNIKLDLGSRDEYMNRISEMKFGVATFQTYSAWSISTTDGLSLNIPYLVPNDFCYPEMVGNDYPYMYKGKEEFIQKFNEMLDEGEQYDTSAIAECMLWENQIDDWFGKWDGIFDGKEINSEATDTIVSLIKKNRFMTKFEILKEMGNWGVRIKWTPYRNALRNNPNIRFTKYGYEWVE